MFHKSPWVLIGNKELFSFEILLKTISNHQLIARCPLGYQRATKLSDRKQRIVSKINPIPRGVCWITHSLGGQILPAPYNSFKRYGFEIWHA